ncbi:24815_t:CDS:2, partial [Racocetra persica]
MLNSEPGYNDYRTLMIPIIIGSLGSMLFMYFNKMGTFFVGLFGGCVLGLTTLSVKDNGLFGSYQFRLVYL